MYLAYGILGAKFEISFAVSNFASKYHKLGNTWLAGHIHLKVSKSFKKLFVIISDVRTGFATDLKQNKNHNLKTSLFYTQLISRTSLTTEMLTNTAVLYQTKNKIFPILEKLPRCFDWINFKYMNSGSLGSLYLLTWWLYDVNLKCQNIFF